MAGAVVNWPSFVVYVSNEVNIPKVGRSGGRGILFAVAGLLINTKDRNNEQITMATAESMLCFWA